jgi:hypothetical protein
MNEWSVNNSVFFLSPHLPTFFVTLHEKWILWNVALSSLMSASYELCAPTTFNL